MRICEIFFSIEGEGLWSGLPVAVLRFSGCNLKCKFCDSKFSSWWDDDTEEISVDEAIKRLSAFPTRRLSITGGEPLYRSSEEIDELNQLIYHFQTDEDYLVKVETNATIYHKSLAYRSLFWSLSPKLKGMGEESHLDYDIIEKYLDQDLSNVSVQLKFVIGSRLKDDTMEEDLAGIKKLIDFIPSIRDRYVPIILQPEGLTEDLAEYALRYATLCERMTFENDIDPDFWDDINLRVMLQGHRVAWNNRRRV